MTLPNRHGATDDYRYGFQGQEKDDEVKGEGNSLNYKFRMHDPRVGRFFAVDPLTWKYPELTPYQFSSNSPIGMLEIEGLEGTPGHGLYAKYSGWQQPLTNEFRSVANERVEQNLIHGPISLAKSFWDNPVLTSATILNGIRWSNFKKGINEFTTNLKNDDPRAAGDIASAFTTSYAGAFTGPLLSSTNLFTKFSPFTSQALKSLDNIVSTGFAKTRAYTYAEQLLQTRSNRKLPRSVSVVYDKSTGKYYLGESGVLKSNSPDLTSELKNMLPERSGTKTDVANCSECNALNNAFKDKAKIENLEIHTVEIQKPRPKNNNTSNIKDNPPCDNCTITTKDVTNTVNGGG
ncbi:RHS repeat-associated core domain-containing protein [Algibacter sp. 2305UL17-15]|uniref:RHS repeat-associated core domain-containing protein n=1 Tax=Algibacter sp. 2305UL17-15 TaxID=3231268 RepID=UPI00345A0F70